MMVPQLRHLTFLPRAVEGTASTFRQTSDGHMIRMFGADMGVSVVVDTSRIGRLAGPGLAGGAWVLVSGDSERRSRRSCGMCGTPPRAGERHYG